MLGRRSLWIVVALGAATIVTASVITHKEKPKPTLQVDENAGTCCGAGGEAIIRPAIETIGSPGAPVEVIAFVGDSTEYDAPIAVLRELAEEHPGAVHVTLHAQTTVKAKEEMKRLGHEGGGFFVNDRKQFTLPGAAGAQREVVFEGAPGEKYKTSDLKAVIEQAMAEAAAETPGRVG